MNTKIFFQKLDERAQIPRYETAGAAAMDLHALLDEPVTIAPRQLVTIPTGLAMALPDETWVALVLARSGLGVKHGISPSNCVGVIDSDYRGEIRVGLTNFSHRAYTIRPGDRFAQLMVVPVARCSVHELEQLPPTARGTAGFGSTGR